LLKSQEISPTHILRYQLESTMFYNSNLRPLVKRKHNEDGAEEASKNSKQARLPSETDQATDDAYNDYMMED